MKKISCLLLCFAMLLSLAACNGNTPAPLPEPVGTAEADLPTVEAVETAVVNETDAAETAAPTEKPVDRYLFNGVWYEETGHYNGGWQNGSVEFFGWPLGIYENMRDELGEMEYFGGEIVAVFGNAGEETPAYIRLVRENDGLLQQRTILRRCDVPYPTEQSTVSAVYITGYRYDLQEHAAQEVITAIANMQPCGPGLTYHNFDVEIEYDGHTEVVYAQRYYLIERDDAFYLYQTKPKSGESCISAEPLDIDPYSMPRREFLTQPSLVAQDDTLSFAGRTWRIDRENMTVGPDDVIGWNEYVNSDFFRDFHMWEDKDKYTCDIEIDGTLYTARVLYKYFEGKDYRDLSQPFLVVIDGYYLRFFVDLEPEKTPQEELDYYINDTDFYIFPLVLAD